MSLYPKGQASSILDMDKNGTDKQVLHDKLQFFESLPRPNNLAPLQSLCTSIAQYILVFPDWYSIIS